MGVVRGEGSGKARGILGRKTEKRKGLKNRGSL